MPPTTAPILVVEDEPQVTGVLQALLAGGGHLVEIATSACAALARVQTGGIDLVLLDLMLPDLDGLQLCRLLRAHEGEVYLPIIMLTGLSDDTQRHAGFAAGADDYVTKPFRHEELLDRVQVWVRARQRLKIAQASSVRPFVEGDVLDQEIARQDGRLVYLVTQAAQRPGYLASVLMPYAVARGWDEAELAAALGCPVGSLLRLLLCQRPLPLTWEASVATLAATYGADPGALLGVLRAAEGTQRATVR